MTKTWDNLLEELIEDASIIHSPEDRRPIPLEEPHRLDGQGPRVRNFFKTALLDDTKSHVFYVEEDALDLRGWDGERDAGHAYIFC